MQDVLIVAATKPEILPLLQYFNAHQTANSDIYQIMEKDNSVITALITGIGIHNTIFSLTNHLHKYNPDLLLNAGIAGSFNLTDLLPGSVVEVKMDRFGDVGAEDKDSTFLDSFELGLETPDQYPYSDGWIVCDTLPYFNYLQKVKAITVNKVHGFADSIQRIKTKYNPDIESMEGAAFHFVAKKMNLKAAQIRAVSNFVAPRNRSEWKIKEAIHILNQNLIQFVETM